MAKLAEFYGIIIQMFSELGSRHHRPHFHARYSGHKAVYAIDQGKIEKIRGLLPRNKHRQVMEWAEEHRIELLVAWDLLQEGESPDRIEPLE